MITPDEAPHKDDLQQQAVEAWFDLNLRRGKRLISAPNRFWPLSEGDTYGFSCIREENIRKVLDRYEAAGWTITGDGPWKFSA